MTQKRPNVIYCAEPNLIFSSEVDDNVALRDLDLAPSLEDYCITVDLEVEIPNRMKSINTTVENRFISIHYTSQDSNESMNIQSGKNLHLENGQVQSFLTTDVYDYSTFQDVKTVNQFGNAMNNSTSELFGINSIDIEYGNYQVPNVTIRFTDIRGISLFAPEELRHNVGTRTVGSLANENIAGSFFKCFFTFPYPKFKLRVKGFYGKPVAYELTCSDFRATFESGTGNFGAVAKFVGYSYSLLGDVTLAALVSAPFESKYGAKYWEDNFAKKYKKLTDIALATSKLLSESQSLETYNDQVIELNDISTNINKLVAIKKAIEEVRHNIFNISKIEGITLSPDDEENVLSPVILTQTTNPNDLRDNIEVKYIKDKNVESSLETLKIRYQSMYGETSESPKFKKEVDTYQIRWIFDTVALYDNVSKSIASYEAQRQQQSKKVAEKLSQSVVDLLGFRPTVKFYTETILAHLETFLYCIHETAKKVDGTNRTLNSLGISRENTDVDKRYDMDDKIGPFFAYTKRGGDWRGIETDRDAWVGELESKFVPEAELIESLLNSITAQGLLLEDVDMAIHSTPTNNNPLCIYDAIYQYSNCLSQNLNGTDVSNLAGRLGIRMMELFGTNVQMKNISSLCGKMDAKYFYDHQFNSNEVLWNIVFSDNLNTTLLSLLTNSDKPKAWDESGAKAFFINNDNTLKPSLFNVEDKDVFPLQNFQWDLLIPLLNTYENDLSKWATSKSTQDKENQNSFLILEKEPDLTNLYQDEEQETKEKIINAVFYGKGDVSNCKTPKNAIIATGWTGIPKDVDLQNMTESGLTKIASHSDDPLTPEVKYDILCNGDVEFSSISPSGSEFITDASLFLDKDYYSQSTLYAKAFYFLKHWGYDLAPLFNDKDKIYNQIPKYAILYLGGIIYSQQENSLNKNVANIINGIRGDVRKSLKQHFIEWVNESYKYIDAELACFDYMQDEQHFDIMGNNKIANIYKEVTSTNKQNIEKKKKILQNYIFTNSNGVFKIYFSSASNKAKEIARDLLTYHTVVTPLGWHNKEEGFSFEKSSAENYIRNFVDTLKKLRQNELDRRDMDHYQTYQHRREQKIALYNYIKILWDRWLSGNPDFVNKWSLKNFSSQFFYIDSFYNKIGETHTINASAFTQTLLEGLEAKNFSLLTFLFKMYQKDSYGFYCVQNFLDIINDDDKVDPSMLDMFKPIPYNKISWDSVKDIPNFIVLFTNEYSKHLDIPNSEYGDDSYMISEDLIPSIDNKTLHPIGQQDANGYKIPAFGVTYGRQNQNFFKDIQVSMDNPIVTEQSLRAQFLLAGQGALGKESSDSRKIVQISPDLFTIYANNSYTCRVTMMGCAWIQPLMMFQLNNVPMFKGTYLIQKVTHHIEQGDMKTTFVGTRMARTESPLIQEHYVSKIPDQTEGSETSSRRNNDASMRHSAAHAHITNTCEYKYYNPRSLDDDNVLDELKLRIKDVIKNKNRHCSAWTDETTILDALCAACYGAVNGVDEVAIGLTATVFYNRYKQDGWDGNTLFVHKQIEYDTKEAIAYLNNDSSIPQARRDLIKRIMLDVFEKSPACLIGKRTHIEDGHVQSITKEENSPKTEEIQLTKEHLIRLFNYATPTDNGYYSNEWKNPNYICHHTWKLGEVVYEHMYANLPNNIYGDYEKPIQRTPKQPLTYQTLFESIKKTIDSSVNLSHVDTNKLSYVVINGMAGSTMKITYNNGVISSELAEVYDIVVNGYKNDISTALWVSDNPSELPKAIEVKLNIPTNSRKHFEIVSSQSIVSVFHEKDNDRLLNSMFYSVLGKYYGEITSTNRETFLVECPNFNQMRDSYAFERIINYRFGMNVINCEEAKKVNFSWDSFTNEPKNKETPQLATAIPCDMNKAVEYLKGQIPLWKDSMNGKCALAVRLALERAGLKAPNHPVSACVYIKFLPKWGFNRIEYDKDYIPQKGDIAVVASCRNHEHGHIHIYDDYDKKWLSYAPMPINPYAEGRDARPVAIFRINQDECQA